MKPKEFHKEASTSRKEEKNSQKNTMPKTEEKILLFAYILKIQRRPNNIAFKVSIYVKLCFTKLFFSYILDLIPKMFHSYNQAISKKKKHWPLGKITFS